MRRLAQILLVGVALSAVYAQADEARTTAELGRLRGTWTVTAAEQGGKPFDTIKGGVLTIDKSSFQLRTASGNELAGEIRVDLKSSPKRLDFVLSTGAVWEAVYSTSGDFFRLNYVERGDAPRPKVLATAADTAGTLIVLRRFDTPSE